MRDLKIWKMRRKTRIKGRVFMPYCIWCIDSEKRMYVICNRQYSIIGHSDTNLKFLKQFHFTMTPEQLEALAKILNTVGNHFYFYNDNTTPFSDNSKVTDMWAYDEKLEQVKSIINSVYNFCHL